MSRDLIVPGTVVPVTERSPTAIDLFMFSASAWLLHRIHYDVQYTRDHDGHPDLLIHGPLQGTYMIQSVQWWLGSDAVLTSISYRHSAPAYLGDTLYCGGSVTRTSDEDFVTDLWVRKADHTVTTHGTATFSWANSSPSPTED